MSTEPRRTRLPSHACVGLTLWLLLLAAGAGGQTQSESGRDRLLGGLDVRGSNTARAEYYDVRGAEQSSAYRFEGWQVYDELSLSLRCRPSRHEDWRALVSGVYNESDYRSGKQHFVPERLQLSVEKGDALLPFRFEAGDIYAYYSRLTLQRSLKGARLELQQAGEERLHSLVLISGATQPTWRDFDPAEDYTNAVSYVVEDPVFGSYGLNLVHNAREGDVPEGAMRRHQLVTSLAGHKKLELLAQKLELEGEIGFFNGDHDGVGDAESGHGVDEHGLFLQVSGRNETPLSYRLRLEEYGRDYRPQGAVVSSARRSREAHAAWRFASGLILRGRLQNHRDAWQSGNPTDTDTYGLQLSGPMPTPLTQELTGSIDLYVQDTSDVDLTVDQRTTSANVNLTNPITENWLGRLGVFHRHTDARLGGVEESATTQVSLNAGRSFRTPWCDGFVEPGVTLRDTDRDGGDGAEAVPTLFGELRRGAHTLAYNASLTRQDWRGTDATDVAYLSHSVRYRYTTRRNVIGAELKHERRDPDEERNTNSYVGAVYWTHYFGTDVGARSGRRVGPAPAAATPPSGPELSIESLAPGVQLVNVRAEVGRSGFGTAAESRGMSVLEAPVFSAFDQRQRLVLLHGAGVLEKAAVIVEFNDVGDGGDAARTFERLREHLVRALGRPAREYTRGDFTGDLRENVNSEALLRIIEWDRPAGTIRFGIPRRLDGQVRMELQFAGRFPPETYSAWSIERVR